jgi:hypothetical protein
VRAPHAERPPLLLAPPTARLRRAHGQRRLARRAAARLPARPAKHYVPGARRAECVLLQRARGATTQGVRLPQAGARPRGHV